MKRQSVPLAINQTTAVSGSDEIRRFSINVPEEALVDLRQRLAATRWPERETVTDDSQGVQLATIQKLFSQELRAAFRSLR